MVEVVQIKEAPLEREIYGGDGDSTMCNSVRSFNYHIDLYSTARLPSPDFTLRERERERR